MALAPVKVSPWPCVCKGRKDISCHWRGRNSRGAEFLIILFKMVKNFKYSKIKFLKKVEINLIKISTPVFLLSVIKQNVKTEETYSFICRIHLLAAGFQMLPTGQVCFQTPQLLLQTLDHGKEARLLVASAGVGGDDRTGQSCRQHIQGKRPCPQAGRCQHTALSLRSTEVSSQGPRDCSHLNVRTRTDTHACPGGGQTCHEQRLCFSGWWWGLSYTI